MTLDLLDDPEADAIIDGAIIDAVTRGLPREAVTLSHWCDRRLILPREMAAEPGPISLDRTPYLRQILDDLTDPTCEEIVLMFSTQLGKSTALLAFLCYIVDHEPAPVMMVLPTVDVGKKFSKQRIAPLVMANEFLKSKIRDARSRDSGNTTLVKEFRGGFMVITGANSASGLASMPCKVLLFDEVDDYNDDAGGQGEPIHIATARQDTFGGRKRVKSSSPKRPKGQSVIETAFQSGTMNDWFMPCPSCGHMQTLVLPNLRWPHDPTPDPDAARYACAGCGELLGEHHKPEMLANGRWVAAMPDSSIRSYRLNSLNSPLGWLPWRTIAREFLSANEELKKGNPQPLRTFLNTRICETWEEQAQKIVANDLQKSAEPFPLGVVPADALLLVAFCDVQDDRFELGVWGLGESGEMWTVDHRVIPANPGHDEDWTKLDEALKETFPHALGGRAPITAAAIDSGGHYTHDVYRFVRRMPSVRKIAATKGMDKPGMPILGRSSSVDVNVRGGVVKSGAKLWHVGVNAAKDLLFSRLTTGRVHVSDALPNDWFEQMASEHRVLHRTARGERSVWLKRTAGARNEAWDIAVGAIWCAERLGVSKWTPRYWSVLRGRLTVGPQPTVEAPAEPDNTPPKPDIAAAITPAPVRRVLRPGGAIRPGGFVNAWKRQ